MATGALVPVGAFPEPPIDVCYVRVACVHPLFHRARLRFAAGGVWSLRSWLMHVETRDWSLLFIDTLGKEMCFRVRKQTVRVRWTDRREFDVAMRRARPSTDNGRVVSATL